jgi:hypothetical protein
MLAHLTAASDEMKTIDPKSRADMFFSAARDIRTPDMTLASKNSRQRSSVIWKKSFDSKMPMSLIRSSLGPSFSPISFGQRRPAELGRPPFRGLTRQFPGSLHRASPCRGH